MGKHTKKRQFWDPEQIIILTRNYADSTPQEMEKLLHGVFTANQISHKAKKLKIRKSDAYKEKYNLSPSGRFMPGSVSWNTGKHHPAHGRSAQTQFKRGMVPANHRPVGSIRITVDGYVEIKVAEGMHQWRLLHREAWKQHHGKYPPRGMPLIFIDGNKQNCDISNLQLITRKQLMARNTIHNYPEPIREITRLRAVITRRINGN